MTPEPEPASPTDPVLPNPPAAWTPAPTMRVANPQRAVQVGLALLTLTILAVAVAVAFVALLDVVEIWFEYQWVPVARAGLAVLVAGLCLYVLRLLLKGKLVKA